MIALAITAAIVAAGTALGFLAGARRKMDLEQWTVGSRGFGLVLMYLLMAGEIYTTFSFLGASGWAYSRGGPSLYILAYMTLAYLLSFFILPVIWEMGAKYSLQTQADFFRVRYGHDNLARAVSLLGIVSMIPYVQLQLTGLGIIVNIASFDAIGRTAAMTTAAVLVAAFVYFSGVRAVAWVSVLKDILMLAAAITIGTIIPFRYYGGIGAMFGALVRARPSHLTMPGGTPNLTHSWYISTVLLTSFGAYMWPSSFGSAYTAKSGDTLRRNAIVMPLYGFTLAFVFFAGFSTVLALPGLANGDLAMLTLVRRSFPAWFLGIVGGAGALTAMVPAAILLLTAATLFVKNLIRPLAAPGMSEQRTSQLSRVTVVALSCLCLLLAIRSSVTLVSLLLLGYAGVAQFFPGVVLGLFWRRANANGVLAGLLIGVALAAFLVLTKRDPWFGVNAGFVALTINFTVAWLWSALLPSANQAGDPITGLGQDLENSDLAGSE